LYGAGLPAVIEAYEAFDEWRAGWTTVAIGPAVR
jgi:hypothetical protein